MKRVAVLCAAADSVYKSMEECDVYDLERDAYGYRASFPVVCHPPCAQWSRLYRQAKQDKRQKELAVFCTEQVRRCGGVLEHPAGTSLLFAVGCPSPGNYDKYGGWVFPVDQFWFGHQARKRTVLYIVGIRPYELPLLPYGLGYASKLVENLSKKLREATPPALARWLVDLAVSARKHEAITA